MEDESLLSARRALERGDYGQCLRLLQPLADQHPPSSPFGGQLRLLMVTAWIGQGDTAAEALEDLRSASSFHLDTFAPDTQPAFPSEPCPPPASA